MQFFLRRFVAAFAVIVVTAAASGCVQGASSVPMAVYFTESSDVSLDGVVYAVYVSPQDVSLTPSAIAPVGRVLLVKADGTFSEIRTEGMYSGRLLWDSQGLAFSDAHHDYWVDDAGLRISATETETTTAQYGVFRLANGRGVVGIYNYGYVPGFYASRISFASGGASADVTQIPGAYDVLGQCDDGAVYGVTSASGIEVTAENEAFEAMSLVQLVGKNGTRGSGVIATYPDAQLGYSGDSAACHGNELTYIINPSGERSATNIAVWDVSTGAFRQTSLVGEDGKTQWESGEVANFAQFNSSSLSGRYFDWYGGADQILSTNIDSGKTVLKFRVEGRKNDVDASMATFDTKSVSVFVSNDGDSRPRIVRYDRMTGEQLDVTPLPDFLAARTLDVLVQSFVRNPALD